VDVRSSCSGSGRKASRATRSGEFFEDEPVHSGLELPMQKRLTGARATWSRSPGSRVGQLLKLGVRPKHRSAADATWSEEVRRMLL